MGIKFIIIASVILFSFTGCGSTELMLSNKAENAIVVDGNQDEWTGKLKFIENEKVAVGFQNDDDNLYICFVSADRTNIMKILSLGLTVWFNPESGDQPIGLQFPKRMDKVAPRNLMGKNRDNDERTDFQVLVNTMMQNQGEYSIVNEDEEILYASPIGGNDGYLIKIGAKNQQFVYEAKIPIGNNNLAQIPLNVFPNEKIKIAFVSGEIDMKEMNSELPNGGEMAEGQGGGRGKMGGVSGAGQTRESGVKKLNFDVDVKLAN